MEWISSGFRASGFRVGEGFAYAVAFLLSGVQGAGMLDGSLVPDLEP